MSRRRSIREAAFVVLATLAPAGTAHAQLSPDDAVCQPPASPQPVRTSVLRLASPGEPGALLTLTMRLSAAHGAPLRDVTVYVYHANAAGEYVPGVADMGCLRFHGRLHGWARPDSAGAITVHTIRPGAYPRSTEPAHLHVIVQFPGRRGFYLNDVMFDDDPRLTPAIRAQQQAPGGTGIVTATRDGRGGWRATRHIVLQPPTR